VSLGDVLRNDISSADLLTKEVPLTFSRDDCN